MDGNGQLFDTESLSFDSTLESLLEADFLMDDKDAYIPTTEAGVSTQENYGVDIQLSERGTKAETSENVTKNVDNDISEWMIECGTNGKTAINTVDEDISAWPNECLTNAKITDNIGEGTSTSGAGEGLDEHLDLEVIGQEEYTNNMEVISQDEHKSNMEVISQDEHKNEMEVISLDEHINTKKVISQIEHIETAEVISQDEVLSQDEHINNMEVISQDEHIDTKEIISQGEHIQTSTVICQDEHKDTTEDEHIDTTEVISQDVHKDTTEDEHIDTTEVISQDVHKDTTEDEHIDTTEVFSQDVHKDTTEDEHIDTAEVISHDEHIDTTEVISQDEHIDTTEVISQDEHIDTTEVISQDGHIDTREVISQDEHKESVEVISHDGDIDSSKVISQFDRIKTMELISKDEHIDTNEVISQNGDMDTIVGEANVLSNTRNDSECSSIQISNDTETTQHGSIEILNLDEIKAKRKKKIAEKELGKAKENGQKTNNEEQVTTIRNDNVDNESHEQLNCNRKRKLDECDDEELKDMSNKQHKGDETCVEEVAIDIQNSPAISDSMTDNSDLDAYIVEKDENWCNDALEISNSNILLENPESSIETQDKLEVSSDGAAFESVDEIDDTLTEDIVPIPPEELINIQDDDDSEIDYDQLEITGPPGGNGNDVDVESGEDASDLDENEIDAWLDEGLVKKGNDETGDRGFGGYREEDEDLKNLKPGEFTEREKLILEEKGVSPLDVLPPGWVKVTHICGMSVYLHKDTRVCTMAKPYDLGPLSARRHEIPLSAIPCLQYKQALEQERIFEEQQKTKMEEPEAQEGEQGDSQKEADKNSAENPNLLPKAVIQSVDQVKMLDDKEIYNYCKNLFQFKTLMVRKFRTWREKRSHMVAQRKNRDKLPGLHNSKLITCTFPNNPDNPDCKIRKKKKFALNPVGKSPVCILHEYTQHVLGYQPTYVYKEIENSETPFKAIILINGIQYGAGVASGKRQAKAEAAKSALEVFMPQLCEQWKIANGKSVEPHSDLKYFEDVDIEDPRVMDLSDKAALPKPYCVLIECLRRNFGLGDTNLVVDKKQITNQKTEFSLTVGKHHATVVSRNKREGKQRAAQAMLKCLHPKLTNWAAILRLYSKDTELGFQERDDESNAKNPLYSKEKNFEILDKLKEAMRKVRAQREEKCKPVCAAELQILTQPIDL